MRNVLFLCTGNSARSILAEAILNRLGEGRFKAYSAGSLPAGKVNPYAIALLQEKGFPVEGLRSKSWDEFAPTREPGMDVIITVCDNAAGESCPHWPGHPITAHWGIPDPAGVDGTGDKKEQAFEYAYERLSKRIEVLLALPLQELDDANLKLKLVAIGQINDGKI